MAVKIGSARQNEFGGADGGVYGDQTGAEVSTQNWYLHYKGWKVFRAKDPDKRELIAQDMQFACDNNNIGYCQDHRDTLYNASKKYGWNCSKVITPCEVDCSALVRVCCLYAGISVPDFYTGNEAAVLMATGQFEELIDHRFTTSSLYLMRGDILVTRSTGHTVVVLSDGDEVKKKGSGYVFEVETVKKGSEGASVLLCQELLKVKGFKGADGKVLQLDGDAGDNTIYAINKFQEAMRKDGIECGTNGANDSSCGQKCWKALLGL